MDDALEKHSGETVVPSSDAGAEDMDRTIVSSEKIQTDCDRTVVMVAPVAEDTKHPRAEKKFPKKKLNETVTHFSFFKLDHTWFQSGKDVNERIDRNLHASLDDVRMDSIRAFGNAELFPKLAEKDELYEEIKVFNEGGQGIISKVHEKALDRVVAVKSLRKELLDDPVARRNFLTEAKVSAQLEHPAIIPVYSLSGDGDKGLHLAMKLISGMTLSNYLEETVRHYTLDGIRHFNEEKALRFRLDLFLRICDAMSYAHAHNVMHRDLKPENIIIGEFREVYIMDWGIATHIVTQPEDTEDGKKHVSGTPRFMAPEVIRGEEIDQRADVYALGLILFEMVYLKTGYIGKDMQEIFGKVLRGECESFEHYFGKKISPELTAIIKKAMHPMPAVRYQSVAELAQDLRRYLDGDETQAHPDNQCEKIVRFAGKHRRGMAITLTALLLLILGNVAHSLYQQRNEQRYRVRYNRAVGYATSKMDDTGYRIESQMLKLENILRLFCEEMEVRLDNPAVSDARTVLPPMKPGAGEGAPGYSKIYKQCIDPAHMTYAIAPENSNREAAMRELQQIAPMFAKTRERFLHSDLSNETASMSTEELEQRLYDLGNPILWLYFGSANGLFLQYPRGSALPEDYEPRRRLWYQTGTMADGDRLVWSKPYLDAQTDWTVLTCTKAFRRDGKLVGVAALDVMLEHFQYLMETYGTDSRYTMGKYLLDREGNILVAADQEADAFWRRKGETRDRREILNVKEPGSSEDVWREVDGLKLNGKALFMKMWWGDIGQIVLTKHGHRVLVLYSRIRSLNWLYVEFVDLDRFIRENWDDLDDLEKLDRKLKKQAATDALPEEAK